MTLNEATEKLFSALEEDFPVIREYGKAPARRTERIICMLALKECTFPDGGESFSPVYRISVLGDFSVSGKELYITLENLLEKRIFPQISELKSVKINPAGYSHAFNRTECSADVILAVNGASGAEKPVLKLSETVSVTVLEYLAERSRNRGQQLTAAGAALLWDGGEKPLSCAVKGYLSAPADWAFLDSAVAEKQSFSFVLEGIRFPEMTLVSYKTEQKPGSSPYCYLEFLSEKPKEVIGVE